MQPSSGVLVRERVCLQIEAAAEWPVVLVAAPGGFGKSVALAQFLDTSTSDHIQCVVSPADSTVHSFARRLLEIIPVDAEARETLKASLGMPAVELAYLFAHHLANYRGTIAIDDLHYATGEGVSAFLAALVDATVSRVRWVIASRSHKDLPVAEWILRGTCAAPLTSEDLAFTLEEATTLALVLDGVCPEEDIEKILALRGFPLAFILAVRLANAGAGASKVIAQARELSYDYLARHVYDLLTADEQRHLQFGALMRTFDCELFEQAGFSNARRVLHRLYRHGSFLVVSDQPDFYLCNDVFLDFLEGQLRLRPLEEQRALRKIAADVMSARNRDMEAMALYAQAEEYVPLMALLQRRGFDLIGEGHRELIKDLLERIPRVQRDAYAISLALEAQLIGIEERFAQAETLFLRAIELSADSKERIAISYRFATYQMTTKVADAQQRYSEIARTPGVDTTMRLGALASALLARTWLDPFCDVGADLDEIEPLIATCERETARASLTMHLGVAAANAGDDRAVDFLARAEERAERQGLLTELGLVYQIRALFALYCDGDLNTARAYADRRLQLGMHITRTRARRGGVLLNMRIALRGETRFVREHYSSSTRACPLLTTHRLLPRSIT